MRHFPRDFTAFTTNPRSTTCCPAPTRTRRLRFDLVMQTPPDRCHNNPHMTLHSQAALIPARSGRTFARMPVLPPRGAEEKTKPVTVSLPIWLVDRLDQLAEALGYRGRSELVTKALEGALPELEQMAERVEPKGKK
ncbi:ribbon-helix-helix domain-containing protein [Myxococcus landrumensis]|uniref:ribbon-helix-helix domain-containing protein n=1 Tax=Myxococcus landrumensis TaxID=2813577 RepID=UPI0035314E17